ncbi:MAG: aspartate--tRNA ligase [Bacteroidota bacterium]
MYRTHNCGELNISNKGQSVILSGWVQRIRDKGSIIWIDLRDRYGITQLVLDTSVISPELIESSRKLGREFVIQVSGKVVEREAKNKNMETGEIEIVPESIKILNSSVTPPFTIEENTDGGDDLRMKYRYLDLRRKPVQQALILRHKIAQETRKYLDSYKFIEVETPCLIKSTPEGARDFVVPSRMNEGQFYALPQSPQTFKQLLMISGFDRYFQIVKCFRDEDLRADRQPEFTQIDCEMSFVNQNDVLETFEGLIKHLFRFVKGIDFKENFQRMTYQDAMNFYGCDKPDIRFDMKFTDISDNVKGKGFLVFDQAEYIGGISAGNCSEYTRKQLDELIEFVRKPQIGAKGLVYIRCNSDGSFKSSVDKFYNHGDLKNIASKMNAQSGDLILILAGNKKQTQTALSELRLEMGNQLGLRKKDVYAPLWIIDFPLFEWDEETKRYYAMHHPFTSPAEKDFEKFITGTADVSANAYDLVVNGVELGGGSIRIHDQEVQKKMFDYLGFTKEEAHSQFGFLMNAFTYGAPPHGGIAFGFDRLTAIFAGHDTIRDVIAFPKNNSGRDVMIDSPSKISDVQLNELNIVVRKNDGMKE